MNKEAWRLTDDEVDKYMKKGFGVAMEAQRVKRQAFEDGGGVILNPQALEVLYEALKDILPELKQYVQELGGCDHSVGICFCGLVGKMDNIEIALAKAEEE